MKFEVSSQNGLWFHDFYLLFFFLLLPFFTGYQWLAWSYRAEPTNTGGCSGAYNRVGRIMIVSFYVILCTFHNFVVKHDSCFKNQFPLPPLACYLNGFFPLESIYEIFECYWYIIILDVIFNYIFACQLSHIPELRVLFSYVVNSLQKLARGFSYLLHLLKSKKIFQIRIRCIMSWLEGEDISNGPSHLFMWKSIWHVKVSTKVVFFSRGQLPEVRDSYNG